MAIDYDMSVPRRFFAAVADFVRGSTVYSGGIVAHTVTPDESHDLTLISRRVYGNSHEYMAVMASAGLSHVDDKLTAGKIIYLPLPSALEAIKRSVGMETDDTMIADGKPIWMV